MENRILLFIFNEYTIMNLAIIGLLLSIYSYYVEKRVKANQNYKPACDISDRISCTKAIISPYGTLGGEPTWLWGMNFYTGILVLNALSLSKLLFFLCGVGLLVSFYLGFVLFTKVKVLCPVCIGIYLVNILLCMVSFYQYKGF